MNVVIHIHTLDLTCNNDVRCENCFTTFITIAFENVFFY